MPQRRPHVTPSIAQSELAVSLAALRESLDAPTVFPADAEAEAASASAPMPELDLRDVPFATLDPAGSRDLDQAFHLQRVGGGYSVRYAIADVPSFVSPGGPVDTEARRRGQTLYAADGTIPLHPTTLSGGSASLLPDVDRPALVWTFDLDSAGAVSRFRLERALIRSRARLDYAAVQASIDRSDAGPAALLPEIGAARMEQERLRGGASLNLPDDEVVRGPDGRYAIVRRQPRPVEEWNAQLSLMTGMAAASLMLDAGVGVLRVMPQPDEKAFAAFRIQTQALGRPWTSGRYGDYLRGLDRSDPLTLPVLEAASSLFRGAGYVAFDGSPPPDTVQAAIGAPYTHATAPLRRLVDRWSLAICLAVSRGEEPPTWARQSLSSLPALMQESGRRASRLDAETVNRVEAALLSPLVGSDVEATVIATRDERATVQLSSPVVTASVRLPAVAGTTVRLRVVSSDIATGTIELAPSEGLIR